MKAFITGVTGQDGHYLSELLQENGYDVYGLVRRTYNPSPVPAGIHPISGDVTDPHIIKTIRDIAPDEIYNLAAMSFVWESFKTPKATFDINAVGALNMLEAAKQIGCKYYQASTSEMFGGTPPPQNETSPFYPRSPYGIAKLAAYWSTVNYREAYGLFACNGILFNHESPRRGREFVSRKVCDYVRRLREFKEKITHDALIVREQYSWKIYDVDAAMDAFKRGDKLKLGNLSAIRDWGHAKDYVKGMWLMMQQDKPDDYVLATGEGRTVEELLRIAFGYIDENWKDYVEIDPELYRPSEVHALVGDASKAESIGWKREYTFELMIEEMIDETR